jgi:ankyrin repeat protein
MGALLHDGALLRRVLEREPALVSRIASHADFLEALFSRPEALRGLLRAPLVRDDYQFDQLLASVGGKGANLRARPGKKEARLLHLLSDAEETGRLLREQPALAAAVATNPAFVEQVKVRKPHFYRALLEKAHERFGNDAGLLAEIKAEQESLEVFTSEGGKKEGEAERKARQAGEKLGWELHEAAREGRVGDVKALLKAGANPNVPDEFSFTALRNAANNGHAEAVRALLEGGANPNIQDRAGTTALVYAASMRQIRYHDIVRALLKAGANPNLQDIAGGTALMYAAFFGRSDTVRVLLERGADPNIRDLDGQAAFAYATSRRSAELLAAAERKQGGSEDGDRTG